jgi:hypothetical protein
MGAHRRSAAVATIALLGAVACVPPRVLPLSGVPTTMHLPTATLPPGHERLVFRWHYHDPDIEAVGDGSARLAAPDSARLDFVADHGMGGGYALLFGDTLVAPSAGVFRRYLPPVPLLWAGVGRLAVPPAVDTVVRLDGDTLRADIGALAAQAATAHGGGDRQPVWRVAFVAGQLVALARLTGGRVREAVTRRPESEGSGGSEVKYDALGGRRTLTLTRVRSEAVSGFDEAIWRRRR